MLENIKKCKKCMLCKNQKPLLDKSESCDIMWVGLSAKKVEDINKTIPLCNDTNSGKIIEKIENTLGEYKFYKTNLVKCLPLDKNGKLRYPTTEEMNSCIENLLIEIKYLQPKIIFILGKKAYNSIYRYFISNNIDTNRIYYIEHPSYIYIYKKKYIEEYIEKIKKIAKNIRPKIDK
jgi:DNA polymerase